MPSRYNHEKRILQRGYSSIRAINPGMIIEFNYNIPKTSDKKPLVFVLWNDDLYKSGSKSYLIHGVNINYLNDNQFKKVFNKIIEGNKEVNIPYTEESTYDDTSPTRNLIKKEFTKIDLPYAGNIKGGRKLTMSEGRKQLDMLYEKQIKPFVKSLDIYRTYKIEKIKTLKAVKYDMEF